MASNPPNGNYKVGQNQNALEGINTSQPERIVQIAGGGALALFGLSQLGRNPLNLLWSLLGGGLIFQGVTGKSFVYKALSISTADQQRSETASVEANRATKIEKSVTVNRPVEELYQFWRNFENLPQFMNHLEEVHVHNDQRSQWVAKAPAGAHVKWEAEIVNETPNELIAWRSVEGSDVSNAGSVHFKPAPDGRGTVVRVVMEYNPPAGVVGMALATILGENPQQQVADDLQRFKSVMETGEVPTSAMQADSSR